MKELVRELTTPNGCKANLMPHRMAVSAVPDLATRMIFFLRTGGGLLFSVGRVRFKRMDRTSASIIEIL